MKVSGEKEIPFGGTMKPPSARHVTTRKTLRKTDRSESTLSWHGEFSQQTWHHGGSARRSKSGVSGGKSGKSGDTHYLSIQKGVCMRWSSPRFSRQQHTSIRVFQSKKSQNQRHRKKGKTSKDHFPVFALFFHRVRREIWIRKILEKPVSRSVFPSAENIERKTSPVQLNGGLSENYCNQTQRKFDENQSTRVDCHGERVRARREVGLEKFRRDFSFLISKLSSGRVGFSRFIIPENRTIIGAKTSALVTN